MTFVRIFVPVLAMAGIVSVSQAAPSLEGTWLSACHSETGQHMKETLTITGHNVSALVQGYSDEQCATPSFAAEAKETIQEGAESTYVKGAQDIDATMTSLSLAYFKPGVIESLNKSKFCGYGDWKVGELKDLTGKKCSGVDFPKAGDRNYSIVQVIGRTLQMGKATKQFDGTSPEKRPRELDATKYSRQ